MAETGFRVATVIPCYRVGDAIFDVLSAIGDCVAMIIVVDDACPDQTAERVRANNQDPRVHVLRHAVNTGVGGAVVTGYRHALAHGADIIVKLDGDYQMDPELLPHFIRPLQEGLADYTKGNRFYDLEAVRAMPTVRIFGNAVLSFLTKASSGYWQVFDPTNGYTAVQASVLRHVPLDKVARGFFFESDMLFRLNVARAVVHDVPMQAVYGEEKSNLKVISIIPYFLLGHARNFTKRVFYNFFLRDTNIGSLALFGGMALLMFGLVFGGASWWHSAQSGQAASAGTVMLAALPSLTGFQLLLLGAGYDIASQPRHPIHRDLMSCPPADTAIPSHSRSD